MYARLCKRLSDEAPNSKPADQPCNFKQLLLNKCRIEFENRAAALESNGSANIYLSEEEEERRQITKRKMLGNIKFMGELGKLDILSESILHRCIRELLVRRPREDPSEDLECLCQIMRTCGRILDSDKGNFLMNQYFTRMKSLADNPDLQPRIRFMLKDIIDLRHDGWMPRKAAVVEGPMPIHQIAPPEDDRPSMNFRRDRENERERMTELFRHPLKTRGGLEDLMGMPITNINISISSTPSLISTQPFVHNGFGSQRDGSYRGHNNQRSGFNNYSNQRGQYKHNQNNSNSQFNQSNKDLAPRFKKTNLIVTKEEVADLALRPNSMLITKPLSLKTNNMNNRMEPPLTMPSVKQASVAQPMLMKEPLPVKQVVQEGKKQSKKDKGPNKEEVLKKFNTLIEEYWKGEIDLKQAINSYKEHKVPDKFSKEVILSGLSIALDKSDVEQEKLIKLLSNLREDNLVNSTNVQDAFKALCHVLDEPDNETNKVITSASVLFSTAICEHLIPLSDVAVLTDNGAHYPLFLLVLQHIHKKRGKSELSDIFNKSKINLITQLPENDKTKERLSEILEERDLTFLYPLLRIQADLARQLQADPNPQSFYKWIKENLEASNFNDAGFINALMTVLLKYITQESSGNGGDEKAVAEKESSFLKRYQSLLYTFLRDKSSLQLVALYSLQMHFYSMGFPRGQLLRWFIALYDMEIVDEEAFLNWKEDVTDAYPGKGDALFQVNQWLTWLQEAESEEEEGDD